MPQLKNITENVALGKQEIRLQLKPKAYFLGLDENDMEEADLRIQRVEQLLLDHATRDEPYDTTTFTANNDKDAKTISDPIYAFFMLFGNSEEYKLASTMERELGFAAHHAIHHMAMVKIIAQQTLQLPLELLPVDFGKAPSTIVYDNSNQ